MVNRDSIRLAFLVPSVELGAYWLPVLKELEQLYPQTVFYTGQLWPGFDPNLPGASVIQKVGNGRYIPLIKTGGYARGFFLISPAIIGYLLKFKPQIVFAQAFSLWTLLAWLFQPLGRWKLVIIYDGSSPNSDFRDSPFRTFFRKLMSRSSVAFISNSLLGNQYLTEALDVPENLIFHRVYLVPDPQSLQPQGEKGSAIHLTQKRPIFLYVGRITQRKGIKTLLEACSLLKTQGYQDYSLLIVGEGDQRQELEQFIEEKELKTQITWVGWVDYQSIGAYFQQTDVFVFPTFEDVWGMVVPEAMVFGKPILCSQGAAALELMEDGKNGYIFDPQNPQQLATVMAQFLDHPELISTMGTRSQELIANYTPQSAAKAFAEVADWVLDQKS